METIAFLSSMMFLAVFVGLFWLDRRKRNEASPARGDQEGGRKDLRPPT
jgi:hypothetical protein